MTTTWLDLCGLVNIYLDGEWKKDILLEIRENIVVYSLSGDPEKYIMSKDEARSSKSISVIPRIVRVRGVTHHQTYSPYRHRSH